MYTAIVLLLAANLLALGILIYGQKKAYQLRQTEIVMSKELTKQEIRLKAEFLKSIGFISSINDFEMVMLSVYHV